MSAAGVGAVLGALQFAARTRYKGLARWIADDVDDLRGGLDCFFAIARILALGGGAVRGGICGDVADGGDEHDGAESRAGSNCAGG